MTEAIEASEQYKQSIVKIFDQKGKIIGTGCCLKGGYILTCAHVVTQSLGLGKKPDQIAVDQVREACISVQFHFAEPAPPTITTTVVPALWKFFDEDLALLRLEQEPAQPLSLQPHGDPWSHPFTAFGFPDGHPVTWIEGKVINEQTTTRVQIQGGSAEGLGILPGFSGAPVWDKVLGCVVGLVVSRDSAEDVKIGFMVSHKVLQKLAPVLEVLALLAPLTDRLQAHWSDAYWLVHPQAGEQPFPQNLEQGIVQLIDLPSQVHQAQQYPRLELFLLSLCFRAEGLSTVQTWLRKRLGPGYEALRAVVQREQERQQQEQQASTSPHLLCQMQREAGGDRYLVKAYFVAQPEQYNSDKGTGVTSLTQYLDLETDEEGKFTKAQLPSVIHRCLDEAARKIRDIRNLHLDIFVSLEDLGLTVDNWPLSDKPGAEWLGGRYHVVLRLVERWQSGYIQSNGAWENKWECLMTQAWNQSGSQMNPPSPALQVFCCGDEKKPKKIRRELRLESCMGLVLNSPPDCYDAETFGPFQALLEAGTPVALWPRQAIDSAGTSMAQLLEQPLSELLAQVQTQRQEAEDEAEDDEGCYLGQHLAFLWEDPALVPPFVRVPNDQSRLRSA